MKSRAVTNGASGPRRAVVSSPGHSTRSAATLILTSGWESGGEYPVRSRILRIRHRRSRPAAFGRQLR
jgi:hypothetical protein